VWRHWRPARPLDAAEFQVLDDAARPKASIIEATFSMPQVKGSPQGERDHFDQFLFRDLHVATIAQERMQNIPSVAGSAKDAARLLIVALWYYYLK
jgi:hypothetical protein